MTLDVDTQENIVSPLNPEHEIVKKYLEFGNWEKTDIPMHTGKRAVLKVIQYHLTHCIFETDSNHKIVKKYLEYGNWKTIRIHSQQGKRAIENVLIHHMVHCLQILPDTSKNQKVIWNCPVCHKEMIVSPYEAKRRTYCSYECFKAVSRKRKPTSEKRKFRMSPEWRNLRKKRISDFGNICPITLKKERIDLHHIDSDWSNNEPENLIPLQRELHRLVTARANYDDFLEARDRAIFSSITRAWKENQLSMLESSTTVLSMSVDGSKWCFQ